MHTLLARLGQRWQVEATGITMGEITFIKDGYATVIHDNGDMTVTALDRCDQCLQWQTTSGGLQIRDYGQEVTMWLCAECRA